MATYIGGNHRLTLQGVRDLLVKHREYETKHLAPAHIKRPRYSQIRAAAEVDLCNRLLATIDLAIATGPTPPAVLANMLAEKAEAKEEEEETPQPPGSLQQPRTWNVVGPRGSW